MVNPSVFAFVVRHLRPLRFVPGLPYVFDCALRAATVVFHPERATAIDAIEAAVGAWPGMALSPHRFGGMEFRAPGRGGQDREIGHLHGNGVLDVPLTKTLRVQLVAEGRACPHHVYPQSGWVTFYVRGRDDAASALALLQLAYALRQKTETTETPER